MRMQKHLKAMKDKNNFLVIKKCKFFDNISNCFLISYMRINKIVFKL